MLNRPIDQSMQEETADNTDFIGPCIYRSSIYKGNLITICLLNVLLMYNFEVIWACIAMSDQTQLICDSQKNQLHTSTHS